MKKYTSQSLQETGVIACECLESLSQTSSSERATVVGLSGHLGAGKTAFVKCIAKELGIQEEITSPTFVIMKLYPIKHASWKKLVHIDAYRLEKSEELKVLGFGALVSDPGNLIMLEWPENIGLKEVVPESHQIKFEIVNDSRVVEVDF